MKRLDQLEAKLQLMRSAADDYKRDPDHDPHVLLKVKGNCADLAGAIECYKKGETPAIELQAKYLRWPL